MANTMPVAISFQQIPAPYPQAERDCPGGSRQAGFRQPGPIFPDASGNFGFGGMTPMDGFANHPDPLYKPITIVKR